MSAAPKRLRLGANETLIIETPQGRVEVVSGMVSPGAGEPMTQVALYPHREAIAYTPTYFSAKGEGLTAYMLEST